MAEEQREQPRAHAGGHPSAKEYVRIGVILAVLTALEVAVAYTDVPHSILIPTLFLLAIVKFALVVLWCHRTAPYGDFGAVAAQVLVGLENPAGQGRRQRGLAEGGPDRARARPRGRTPGTPPRSPRSRPGR